MANGSWVGVRMAIKDKTGEIIKGCPLVYLADSLIYLANCMTGVKGSTPSRLESKCLKVNCGWYNSPHEKCSLRSL